jgi:hypothetical protein
MQMSAGKASTEMLRYRRYVACWRNSKKGSVATAGIIIT